MSGAGTLILDNTLFVDNVGDQGGAIYISRNSMGYIDMKGVVFTNNTATYGAAVYLTGVSSGQWSRIQDCDFYGNTASKNGGAMYFDHGNTYVDIIGGSFKNNYAADKGGAVGLGSYNTDIKISNSALYSNVAQEVGGGVFVDYQNAITVRNVLFELCQSMEHNGGALAVDQSNRLTLLYSTFIDCTAGLDGGALSLGSNNHHTNITSCTFTGNKAESGAGGGAHIGTSNSYMRIENTTFSNNSARSGGALFISTTNEGGVLADSRFENNSCEGNGGAVLFDRLNPGWTISRATFDQNSAAQSGGAVHLSFLNGNDYPVEWHNCSFTGNRAQDGGGMFSSERNTLTIYDGIFAGNSAGGSGGALYVSTSSTVQFSGQVLFENNTAYAGAAIAIFSSSMWSWVDAASAASTTTRRQAQASPYNPSGSSRLLRMIGNHGQRGSALFLSRVPATEGDMLQDLYIVNNTADIGGTVFWIRDDLMVTEPKGLTGPNSSVVIINNTAPYGIVAATQATTISSLFEAIKVTVYGGSIRPPPQYILMDFYGQSLINDGDTQVVARVDAGGSSSCRGSNAFVAGNDIVQYQNGAASYDDLQASCFPNGTFSLIVTVIMDNALRTLSPGTSFATFSLATRTQLEFRPCDEGEFITEGIISDCQACPAGEFSFESSVDGGTKCVSCHDMKGSANCSKNVIVLENGYWRRFADSTTLLKCRSDEYGCSGPRTLTGDASCEEGYEGPLCGVCKSGYFPANFKCWRCSHLQTIQPAVILLGVLLCLAALVVLYYRCHIAKMTFHTVPIRIVLACLQITFLVSNVFGLQMPPVFQDLSYRTGVRTTKSPYTHLYPPIPTYTPLIHLYTPLHPPIPP